MDSNQHPAAYEADALPLSYAPVTNEEPKARGGHRTHGLAHTRGVLYRLSYTCMTQGHRLESNQQPPHYEGGALSIELLRHEKQWAGLEPAFPVWKTGTLPLSYHCVNTSAPTGGRTRASAVAWPRSATELPARFNKDEGGRVKDEREHGWRNVAPVFPSSFTLQPSSLPSVDSWIRTRTDAVFQTAALPLELSPQKRGHARRPINVGSTDRHAHGHRRAQCAVDAVLNTASRANATSGNRTHAFRLTTGCSATKPWRRTNGRDLSKNTRTRANHPRHHQSSNSGG